MPRNWSKVIGLVGSDAEFKSQPSDPGVQVHSHPDILPHTWKSASGPTTSREPSPRVGGKCVESALPRVRVSLGGQEAKTADTLRASARLSEKDKSGQEDAEMK